MGALGTSCGLKCTDKWKVAFEEMSEAGDGWQVMPDNDTNPGATSILNPPNTLSPLSLRPPTGQSQEQEVVLTCEGKTCVVGKAEPSPARADLMELTSGSLLDSLRVKVREFVQKKRQGVTKQAERMHFK